MPVPRGAPPTAAGAAPVARRRRLPVYAGALAAGALARLVAACCAPGFYARDDYFHVLQPALAWLHDPGFDWQGSGLPGAGIRSHLLPRLTWLALRALRAVGCTEPEAQLRGLYILMGALSLALVPAMYHAARRSLGARVARRAGWAAALFFVFPFAGTRLLIEAQAMAPLCAALACLHGRRRRDALAGGLLFGLAVWWRLQVLAALPGVVWALVARRRGSHAADDATGDAAVTGATPRTGPGAMLAYAAAGLTAALLLQGGFDVLCGMAPWAPLWRNVMVNLAPAAGLSRSGVLSYVGFWLVLSLPPASPWLWAGVLHAARRAPLLALPWVSFVLVHALIPHKEDRFMLPVAPLWAIGLCAAPAAGLAAGGGPWRAWLRRRWPAARGAALAVAACALVLACTAQSQANLRALMQALRADPTAHAAISMGPELQAFLLGERALPLRQRARVSERWLNTVQAELAAAGTPANRFAIYAPDRQVLEVLLRLRGLSCQPPQALDGWWLDRLVYRLNPRRNRRRAPVLLYRCESAALAAAGHTAGGAGKAGRASR